MTNRDSYWKWHIEIVDLPIQDGDYTILGYREMIDWLVVTGTMESDDFPFSWECHHPNWRTPSFSRGVGIPPTSDWRNTESKKHGEELESILSGND